nr:hypothetical protein Q903MT_gene3088 [Picea sitchensis]
MRMLARLGALFTLAGIPPYTACRSFQSFRIWLRPGRCLSIGRSIRPLVARCQSALPLITTKRE